MSAKSSVAADPSGTGDNANPSGDEANPFRGTEFDAAYAQILALELEGDASAADPSVTARQLSVDGQGTVKTEHHAAATARAEAPAPRPAVVAPTSPAGGDTPKVVLGQGGRERPQKVLAPTLVTGRAGAEVRATNARKRLVWAAALLLLGTVGVVMWLVFGDDPLADGERTGSPSQVGDDRVPGAGQEAAPDAPEVVAPVPMVTTSAPEAVSSSAPARPGPPASPRPSTKAPPPTPPSTAQAPPAPAPTPFPLPPDID